MRKLQGEQLPASGKMPELEGMSEVGRSEGAAIGGEGDTGSLLHVAWKKAQLLAGGGVPEANGAVEAAAGKHRAIGRKSQTND